MSIELPVLKKSETYEPLLEEVDLQELEKMAAEILENTPGISGEFPINLPDKKTEEVNLERKTIWQRSFEKVKSVCKRLSVRLVDFVKEHPFLTAGIVALVVVALILSVGVPLSSDLLTMLVGEGVVNKGIEEVLAHPDSINKLLGPAVPTRSF